jgi:dipeptidyl aminopeptidase/acylaminoacyl peptidase
MKGWMSAACAPLLAFSLCASAGAPAPAAQVPIKEFVKLPQYGLAKLSPKGEYLAVQVPKDRQTSLGIIDIKNKKVSAMLEFTQGEHVANYWWVSPNRVVVSIATLYGVLDQPAQTGELYAMDADGTNKTYLFGYRGGNHMTHLGGAKATSASAALVDTLRKNDDQVLIAVYPWERSEGGDTTLYLLDVNTGDLRRTDAVPIAAGVQVAVDDSGALRFAAGVDLKGNVVQYVRDPDGWHALKGGDVNDVDVLRASPDGKSVYLLSDQGKDYTCLRELVLASGEMRDLACNPGASVDRVIFSFDFSHPIAVHFLGGDTQFLDPNDEDGKFMRAVMNTFPQERVTVTSATWDGNLAMVEVDSDRDPGSFLVLDRNKRKAEFVFARRPGIDPDQMAPVRQISYTTRDGATVHGYLTVKQGVDPKMLPLVMLPHGGPYGMRDYWEWNQWPQLLASRGYAVLQVNYRGSGGYGFAFEEAGYHKMGTLMQDDLTDGVRWAIDQKIADPKRVAIFGASYGGYAALMSPEREPDLYRCAVAFAGVYDLYDELSDADFAASELGRELGALHWGKDRKELDEQSPINHVDALKIPVLIAHGSEDKRVPFSQGKNMRDKLKAAHKNVEWMEFSGEEHGFWKDENHVAFMTKVLEFLDKYIGPSAATSAPVADAAAAPDHKD